MKAALLTSPERLEISDIPAPLPQAGEVLIKVAVAGLCGSDYSKYLGQLGGPYGIVPGHEATGTVVEVGPGVPGDLLGRRVAIQPNFPCGTCEICRSGRGNVCPQKVRLGIDVNGVFAQYVSVPYRYVWPLPHELSDACGVLVEPLSVALHGFNKSLPLPGQKVLVYGAGVIGLLFVRLAALSGAWVSALDPSGHRLAVAGELGASKTFNALSETDGEMNTFQVIYEASGVSFALAQIISLAAPGGKIVLTGLPKEDCTIAAGMLVRKELSIQGSMIYTDEFRPAINLLAEGLIKTELFISSLIPLERLPGAIADFRSPSRIKDAVKLS